MSMLSVITTHIGQPLFICHTPIHTSLSYTHSHILFQSPSTHPHTHIFPAHSFPFSPSFPAFHHLSISLPLAFLTLSFALHTNTHTHTRTHTVILSLSHRGTLIKLGWSLMLSPRQQSPWRGWLFQKKKKNMRILQPYDMLRVLRTHRVRHTNMH